MQNFICQAQPVTKTPGGVAIRDMAPRLQQKPEDGGPHTPTHGAGGVTKN